MAQVVSGSVVAVILALAWLACGGDDIPADADPYDGCTSGEAS